MAQKIGIIDEKFKNGILGPWDFDDKLEMKDIYGSDFMGVVKLVDVEKRLLTIVATTEDRDRDGDIISVKGWQLENYKKNPVFLWAHNYSSVPLGAAIKIARKRSPWRIELTHRFPTEGLNPFADMILGLYNERIINAGSVGFIPFEWEKIEDDDEEENRRTYSNRKYLSQELLEHSGCAVPSNPAALQDAIKSFDTKRVASHGDQVLEFLTGEKKYKLKKKNHDDVLFELNEVKEKGIEFEEDTAVSVQVLDDLNIKCQNCGIFVDYTKEPEIAMGAIKCPGCGVVINQEGNILLYNPLFYNDKGEILEDVEMLSEIEEKPYPNEHACRLNPPDKYDSFARKKCAQKHDEKCIDVIYGIKDDKAEIQALRYPKNIWDKKDAKSHCGSRDGKFEPAAELDFDTDGVKFTVHWKELSVLEKAIDFFKEQINQEQDEEQKAAWLQLSVWLSELKDLRDSSLPPDESKTGAVLSTKNKNKLISAQKAIQEVLVDAGVEADEASLVQDDTSLSDNIIPDEPEEEVFDAILQSKLKTDSILVNPENVKKKQVEQLILLMKEMTKLFQLIGGNLK